MQPNPQTSLPDLLDKGLSVLFVGINPSLYSVAQGHYFARKTNRFWPAFSRSVLSLAARENLGLEALEPMHDHLLPAQGFGFTDTVKRPTARASDVSPAEFAAAVTALVEKIEYYRPRIACFHGTMAYRPVHRALTETKTDPALGMQTLSIGPTHLYVVPNPSPANAHFTPADQTAWYDRLAGTLLELPSGP
ncbi:mismatch-specific DNA-glycosylase [Beijerinckia indica]|uniref:Uracil-DNA glycosylase superfamily n=1 Tax=Beijerinckia indica subsp. indica (strain ATCC 9039 / DSM 1715 / NCIMB 8712) TaxID=395963 RepID=B2IIR8_BEII9|nr:mismatch-specific DNA-glycosylase [Beijerinckia indica]ACB94761.1 Uracil-DNA glycosylase superfamily [Beijerinckia indica subsp. indica ATCC 9039]